MIQLVSLIVGVVLLLLLIAAAVKGWLASRELRSGAAAPGEEDATDPCPEEFVLRVFTSADRQFVRGLHARDIERIFAQERKRVALVWTQQTSAAIRQVMREHARASRHSANLKPTREIRLFAEFLAVLSACQILALAIRIVGPLWLGSLAHFAQRVSQQAAALQESWQAGAMDKSRAVEVGN